MCWHCQKTHACQWAALLTQECPVILSKPGHQILLTKLPFSPGCGLVLPTSTVTSWLEILDVPQGEGGLSPAARAGHDGTSKPSRLVNWAAAKTQQASDQPTHAPRLWPRLGDVVGSSQGNHPQLAQYAAAAVQTAHTDMWVLLLMCRVGTPTTAPKKHSHNAVS